MKQLGTAQAAKILIVDDSPTQAKHLEQVLKAHGYRVFVTKNGSEALDHTLAHHPDLVISDILMPEMDGFELCRRIRNSEAVKCLPIILITHLNDPADVLHSLEAGADYFISKPYNDTLLLSLVSTTLQRNGGCYMEESSGEVTISYRGQGYAINAPRAQIIDLLLATYELAADKNQELLRAKRALSELNQELEERVSERTAALVAETAARVQAVEELRKMDKVLIRQSHQAALGEMISNIGHQWRQPLNAVGLLVQGITLSYEYDKLSKEYLDSITKKIMKLIQQMSQTIDDFRNFFTPEKEKVQFDLGKTVATTMVLVGGSLSDKGVRIQVSAQDAPILTGYPNEFSQVLVNILNNATDAFSGQTIAVPLISVNICTENSRAVVTIADNAGGIPEEILDRIFEPYFTTKEQGIGTGIGLYMSKNIIEKSMGGRLTVRNVLLGAEFRIEI